MPSTLPGTLDHGLVAQGVPRPDAAAHLAPAAGRASCSRRSSATTRCSSCWAARCCTHLSHAHAAYLTGRTFFPRLIVTAVLEHGLHEAFDFAIAACLIAAAASWLRGGKYVHGGEHVRPVIESGDGELAMASDGD